MTSFLKRVHAAWDAFTSGAVAPVLAPTPAVPERRYLKIADSTLARCGPVGEVKPFTFPTPLPGVIPSAKKIACDSDMQAAYAFASANSAFDEGLQAMPPSYLAELTQRPEYRRPAEILAKEMTRKWIKLQCTGVEDKTDKLKLLSAEMKRLGVQSLFRKAAEQDGFFGRAQIFIDMGIDPRDTNELKTPLVDSSAKIGKGSLKRLTLVEAIWTYPGFYNAHDPIDPAFFRPQSWFVMGKEIHSSRMLTFVSRPVPDLLKPAYSFGGLSLTQISKPYVDNWLRTRQSVSDLIHSFSMSGLKTDLGSILNDGAADEILKRVQLFNQLRDNRGTMVLDKETEEFFNVSVPLGSLDHLQAQSQEHMAAVTGIPLVKLLGITPSGLNVSSDGEVRSFYDWVEAQQEGLFKDNLSRVINVIQLSLFGEVDPEIGFMFEPLWNLDEATLAAMRKTECETDVGLINAGIIDSQEARVRLAAQEDSPYASLDLGKEIEPPEEPGSEDLDGEGGFSQQGGMTSAALFKQGQM